MYGTIVTIKYIILSKRDASHRIISIERERPMGPSGECTRGAIRQLIHNHPRCLGHIGHQWLNQRYRSETVPEEPEQSGDPVASASKDEPGYQRWRNRIAKFDSDCKTEKQAEVSQESFKNHTRAPFQWNAISFANYIKPKERWG